MRITKSAAAAYDFEVMKNIANAGCDRCPFCGEDKRDIQYFSEGVTNKGISGGVQKSWVEGVFRPRHMKCDCYRCETCGATWESEPYQWC